MLNMIKVDLYRMVRTKMYVCGMDCDGGSYILLHIHVETGY